MSHVTRLALRTLGSGLLLAAVVVGFLVRDGFARWHTSPWEAPRSPLRSWNDVLARPQPIAVETVVTGSIDMNRCDNLDTSNPQFASCTSPAPLLDLAHIVVHRDLGTFLIDSGFSRRFAEKPPYGNYSLAMQLFNRALGVRNSQSNRQDLADVLADRHVTVRATFFTHLHPDHTSGAADLGDAPDYVFGKREDSFLARVAVGSHFAGKGHLKVLDFERAEPMAPLGPSIDLLGDGSLWAISTRGHTPGHTSYLVNGNPPVLLLGDASHFRWAFEHDVPPRAMTSSDGRDADESLRQLRRFAARYPQVHVVFGHER